MTIYYNLTYVKLDSRYSSVITFGICPCDYMQEFNMNLHHIIHLSDCEILLSTQQFFSIICHDLHGNISELFNEKKMVRPIRKYGEILSKHEKS